jgi:predicted hotdog family 3-hydroxylacyl-ACP dehydratase
VRGVLPPIETLLPQSGPMRLLERVVAHDGTTTRCEADPARSALFRDASGRVPAWVAVEYMAQAAAAHGGLLARERGEPPRVGLLVGSRRLTFRCTDFAPGRRLEVTARHAAGSGTRLAFDCAVLDPDGGLALAEGRLNFLVPGESSIPARLGGDRL